MRTGGAVVTEAPGKYEVVDLELDEPRQDELLVTMVASGLCHSDDHIATGDIPVATYPLCGGHEGAGVVAAEYSLDEVAKGYEDMHAGKNIRGIIRF